MTTFAQLRTRASVRFGDPAFDIVTDTTWKDYVNEAYREVCMLEDWPFNETASTSVSITAGSRSATLPTNVWKVRAVYDSTNDNVLAPITNPSQVFRDYPEQTETGQPQDYRIRAQLLEVFPLPETTTTFTVHGLAYAGDLSADADVPALPTPYQHVLVPLAVAKAYRDDGNFGAAQTYESEASVILDAMRRDLLASRTDRFPTILDDWN